MREPLRLEDWLPIYRRICADFDYDEREDFKSALSLAKLLKGRGESSLEIVRKGFPESVIICGGGVSLAKELAGITIERGDYLVAADTAASTLRGIGVAPKMIVTDLDGVVEDQIAMNVGGAAVFVHAHGDNQDAVHKHISRFPGLLVGTCQCEPPPGLFNFGGFTDGDRAACICTELGAKELRLAGFDFEHPTPKPGKSAAIKLKKLRWAKEILGILSQKGVRISNL